MVGVDHVTFAELVDGVSPMSDRLHSLIAGIHLRRVAFKLESLMSSSVAQDPSSRVVTRARIGFQA